MAREPGWIPRNDRREVNVAAQVHRGDGKSLPVMLTDLTEEGCRISAAETLPIGEHIHIEIPRVGFMKAQVRWALEGEAGARFAADDA